MGEIGKGGLQEKDGSEDIDAVLLVERIYRHLREHLVSGHTSVVDDYIDLEFAGLWMCKVILCTSNEMSRAIGISEICLYRQGSNVVLGLDGSAQGVGSLGRRIGSVVENEVGAF